MEQVDSNTLILLSTIYYFVECGLRLGLKSCAGGFYESMRASRKDTVFFGISMGLLITLASTPSCVRGAWNAWYAVTPGVDEPAWFLDEDTRTCVTARAVLWVSELNRLDLYPLYVVHHAGSLISLLSFLYFRWPVLLFTILFSTLGSEVPGDLLWMISAYIDSRELVPRNLVEFKRRLNIFNVIQYAVLRGGGIILVAWVLAYSPAGLRTRSPLMQAHAYLLLSLYAAFCIAYVYRQYKSIRARSLSRPASPTHIPVQLDGPMPRAFHVRLPTEPALIVVPYGVLMGLGFAALVFTALTIAPNSNDDAARLSRALGLTILSAIFFARVFSLVMEDGLARLLAHPLRTIFRPGFWLHGGLFGAAVGGIVAYGAGYVPDFPLFAASLAVGLPLYETFSRIGCHTYGCCFGCPVEPHTGNSAPHKSHLLWRLFPFSAVTYDHPTDYAVTRSEPKLLNQPLLPIQLISAVMFFLLFAGFALPLAAYVSPELAGAATLIAHAAVRLATETCRADYRGPQSGGWISTTARMALVQAVIGGLAVIYVLYSLPLRSASFVPVLEAYNDGRIGASFAAVAVGTLVYGVHVEEIGTWIPAPESPRAVQLLLEKE
ncbi:Prolipo protein diacylglyceryl transferase-domain-containing protein [Roridomyces roridus]|uniref:Prolipo protein diacylglyceryl transferase-domain-containing protein n=1 Tax=Roridomyces roridus TaxID=1738132 RepID=A0AAD7FH88_9AGAR|nr:Prolipo protein diacylglyceryl transferase-domain-containing protein [Roridomyces roridus]